MQYLTLSSSHIIHRITVFLLFSFVASTVTAQTFTDAGFATETVANVARFQTVGFTFAPDGRMFVWDKTGVVTIVKNGALLPTPFIDISSRVNEVGDRGLIGLALDPNFATNGFVYLLYVYEPNGNAADTGPKTARLSRIQADPANPDVALANSEVVLMGKISTAPCSSSPAGSDCMASDSSAHTIGTVKFGSDGKIYVGMGDGAEFSFADEKSFRSQDLNMYNGKILRINPDGTAPSDNPFYDGNPSSVRSKVFVYGLRSPYRFTLKPGTSELYVGDVGSTRYEEINRGRGANFGWPCYEGNAPNPDFQNAFPQQCAAISPGSVTNPIHFYSRSAGGAVVGGTFYNATAYPVQYRGNLFFADYVQNFIQRITFDANNNVSSVVSFATNINTPVALEQGPDGMLYYLSIFDGTIKRIRFNGNAPAAVATASRPTASSPYVVSFSSNGSSNPAGGTLTYLWEFGDGTTSTSANPTHTYVTTGVKTYLAKLTVTNSQGLTASATVQVIVGSRPPTATITTPADGTRAKIGATITFSGTATDPDETLPASAMKWSVLLHHNDHIHPGVTASGAGGSFVIENHGTTGETYFYEVVLTVTDSANITDTKSVNVIPELPTATLPAPWLGQEVGNVGVAGMADFANGTFTVKGSGADITDFNDGFYYVYQKLSGDGQIVARVTSVQNTAFGAKAGVMIRSALTGNAAHTLVSVSPSEGIAFERRDETGFGTALVSGGYFPAPRWVKMVRSGNIISGYHSADGANWTLVSSASINLPTEALIGLAVTAANNTALCTVVFDNVTIAKPVVNRAPAVSITNPANNTTFAAPANIRFAATATDSDGTISKVEFYQGATLVKTVTAAPYEVTLSNLTAGNYNLTAKAYDNSGAVTTSSPVQVSVVNPVNGTGTGLRGEYFYRNNLSGTLFTRTDATVNFDWGSGSPSFLLRRDDFSIRWTGVVQPRFSGNYTFYGTSSDGIRVYVNGTLLVDQLNTNNSDATGQGSIALTAGQKYRIVVEFYQTKADSDGSVKLEWSSPLQTKEIVPRGQLYPQ